MEKRIKILYINHNAGWGGSEQSLYDILKYIDKNKFEPILCVPENGILVSKAKDLNIETYILKNYSWRWYYGGFKARLIFLALTPQIFFYLSKWKNFLKKINPDIVHVNINRVIEQLWVAKRVKIKTILHFRDIPSKVRRPFLGGLKTFYYFANFADYWIANSIATRKDIETNAKSKVQTIYNFIDISEFDKKLNSSIDFKFDDTKVNIAMIGSLVDWKNQKDFIEICKIISQTKNSCRFYIIGTGPMLNSLKSLVDKYNLNDRIIFTDFIENIKPIYKQIDILAHTTIGEPFGRIFIEAMAASRPVVAYNSGGAAEIVVNNETGLLAENGDVKDFAEKLTVLIDSPKLAAEMGTKGRQRVEKNYNSDVIIKQFENYYIRILNEK